MLNLSLIRHARTDLDNSIRDDMSRPISLQGIDETKKVCEFLKKKKNHLMRYSVHHLREPKKHSI